MEWKTSNSPIDYEEAAAFMTARARAIHEGNADECVWMLEHPALYTAGTSAKAEDVLEARFPIHVTGRGGRYTYHGPGQQIAYVMLDLKKRYAPNVPDVRNFVQRLEDWIIRTLFAHGVKGERREGRIGIWVQEGGGRENKIAALGIRISQGVTMHGIAINIDPDLTHFSGIVPCGIRGHGVTSLSALGIKTNEIAMQETLRRTFEEVFG